MGVRYNAEKSKVGNYYSTPIFKFRMKCHLCDSHFEIQTDPKVSVPVCRCVYVCVCVRFHCLMLVMCVAGLLEYGLCGGEWGLTQE